jgi:hypothetical protein
MPTDAGRVSKRLPVRRLWLSCCLCLVVAFFMAPAPASQPEHVSIAVPSFASNAACTVVRGATVLDAQRGSPLRFDCAAKNEMVRCDFTAAEPLDLRLDTVCQERALPIRPAKPAAVRAPEPRPVTTEWITMAMRPPGVRPVALRLLDPAASFTVLVADDDDRFVRFSREGASPVTVPSRDLLASAGWPLPEVVPGGELFVRIEPAPILPVRYELEGPQAMRLEPSRNLLAVRGLPVGNYQLTPVFVGGVKGHVRRFPILDGKSTPFYIVRAAVGAARLSGDEALCASATTLSVTSVSAGKAPVGSVTTRTDVVTLTLDDSCEQVVAGLSPGDYEVGYSGVRGHLASRGYSVVQDQVTAVLTTLPRTRAAGRLLLNGDPDPALSITYTPSFGGRGREAVTAHSDPSGNYEALLPDPGEYAVSFKKDGADLVGCDRTARVARGDNALDYAIDVASLRLDVRGWDRTSPLDVTVRQVEQSQPGMMGTGKRVGVGDELPVDFTGLAPGRYRIEVRQHMAGAADRTGGKHFEIASSSSRLRLDVDLGLSERSVSVVDKAGNPVAGAIVRADGGEALAESSPGRYSLVNIAPGESVTVFAPGYAGTCRFAPESSDLVVTPEEGVEVRVQFLTRRPLDRPVGRLLLSGAECPVPFSQFDYARSGSAEGMVEFLVRGFPIGGVATLLVLPFDQPNRGVPIRVGRDGIARVDISDRSSIRIVLRPGEQQLRVEFRSIARLPRAPRPTRNHATPLASFTSGRGGPACFIPPGAWRGRGSPFPAQRWRCSFLRPRPARCGPPIRPTHARSGSRSTSARPGCTTTGTIPWKGWPPTSSRCRRATTARATSSSP